MITDVEADHTTGETSPTLFRIVVWVLLRPFRIQFKERFQSMLFEALGCVFAVNHIKWFLMVDRSYLLQFFEHSMLKIL